MGDLVWNVIVSRATGGGIVSLIPTIIGIQFGLGLHGIGVSAFALGGCGCHGSAVANANQRGSRPDQYNLVDYLHLRFVYRSLAKTSRGWQRSGRNKILQRVRWFRLGNVAQMKLHLQVAGFS